MPPSSRTSPKARGTLIVVSGPSGVGKTTVIRALAERRDFHFSVSATTRDGRPGEVDGVHYRFVTPQQFEELRDRGELLEWATYSGHLYGTPQQPVEEHLAAGSDVLLDIEVQGAMQVKAAVPESVTIFLMPPSLEDLERRLWTRGDTTRQQVESRLEIAQGQMAIAATSFDHLVVNHQVETAVSEIGRILGETRGPSP
ncbi:MAG: guanylate kinase [Acidimicrobiia bacterium]